MTDEEILAQQQEMVADLVRVTEQKMIVKVLLLIRQARENDATWDDLEEGVKALLDTDAQGGENQ